MFCGKCGTQNADAATFCAGCGSPLNQMPPQPQFMPQQQPPMPPQPQFMPQPQPPMPQQPPQFAPQQPPMPPQQMMPRRETKSGPSMFSPENKKFWMITMIAAAAVAVICIVLLLVLGGSGFSSPEDAAVEYVEGALSGDWDQCEAAFHPDMVGDFNSNSMPDLDDFGFDVDDVEATRCEEVTGYELELTREALLSTYDLYISRMCEVRFSYTCETMFGDMENSQTCTVAEIDGSWYVIEG